MDHWEMQTEQESILDCHWSKQDAPLPARSHQQHHRFWKGLVVGAVFAFLLWIALLSLLVV